MENNYLDKRIRELMEKLEIDFQSGHWEQFEKLLNDPANADLSENALDHSLRNKLSEVNPEFTAGDWSLFEQKLDAELDTPEIEDVYLDGISYELLNDLESPYNPDHWPIMKKRLEEEFSFRYKLVKYKIAELALVALALLTIIQFVPSEKLAAFRFPILQKIQPASDQAASPALQNQDSEKVATTNSPQRKSATSTSSALPTNEPLLTASVETNALTSIDQPTKPERELTGQRNSSLSLMSANSTLDSGSPLSTAPLLNQSAIGPVASAADQAGPKLNFSREFHHKLSLIPFMQRLAIQELDAERKDQLSNHASPDFWKGPTFLRVGMAGTGDLDYVMTPYNAEYDQSGNNQFKTGYGGGLTLGVKFDRWEIETGAMYANKFYTPADSVNVTVTNGSLAEGYEGVGWTGTQLDVLRIPIRARYGLVQKGKWHVYTQAGLAANLTLSRIHSKEVRRVGNNSLRSPGASTFIYTDVNENLGLLEEEGTFKDNHFFTVDLGLGVERFLSSRFSIFTQPALHYQLGKSKIGLNGERINTISVETGVRVSLKKK